MIQWMLAIWSLVPLPFLKPAWTSGSSWFMYCWSLAWWILSITLLACEISPIVQYFEHSLVLPFFGIGMKTDLFQSCGHCSVYQICWHIECSTFTASSFRIWNSWTGIPSPPWALFVVMLPTLRNLCAGQEATVRTEHGITDWFQIRKVVRQVCIFSPCLFNLYAKYIMWTARLDEAQAGIKIARRNTNNPQIHRWHHLYGRKWRRTKEALGEGERGEWKS